MGSLARGDDPVLTRKLYVTKHDQTTFWASECTQIQFCKVYKVVCAAPFIPGTWLDTVYLYNYEFHIQQVDSATINIVPTFLYTVIAIIIP